jgi:hypothetical protein
MALRPPGFILAVFFYETIGRENSRMALNRWYEKNDMNFHWKKK